MPNTVTPKPALILTAEEQKEWDELEKDPSQLQLLATLHEQGQQEQSQQQEGGFTLRALKDKYEDLQLKATNKEPFKLKAFNDEEKKALLNLKAKLKKDDDLEVQVDPKNNKVKVDIDDTKKDLGGIKAKSDDDLRIVLPLIKFPKNILAAFEAAADAFRKFLKDLATEMVKKTKKISDLFKNPFKKKDKLAEEKEEKTPTPTPTTAINKALSGELAKQQQELNDLSKSPAGDFDSLNDNKNIPANVPAKQGVFSWLKNPFKKPTPTPSPTPDNAKKYKLDDDEEKQQPTEHRGPSGP